MRAFIAALAAAAIAVAGCGAGSSGGSAAPPRAVYGTGLPTMSAFAWDAEGRLWVATAAYTSAGKDAVWMVAGQGARPVEVVSGLKTPLGLVWSAGWLYVSSLGRVDAYAGFDGTRFTRQRTVLGGPLANGENNELALAPDGRLLMGVSAPCDHCMPASSWAATIVSFNTDGSDQRVYARGIRAPFGLALRAGTNDLYVTMNQRDDLGERTPGDWLAIVRDGQDWGFPACYGQGGADCEGVPAPTAVLDPHAGAGGVAFVGGSALVAEWALGKVERVALGSGAVTPYLTGLKNPLPVISAPDGGVLVGDWGTGTIYRVG